MQVQVQVQQNQYLGTGTGTGTSTWPQPWNPPATGGFPSQKASNAGFGVLFDVSLNKRLNKQSSCRRFETPRCPLWRHAILFQENAACLEEFSKGSWSAYRIEMAPSAVEKGPGWSSQNNGLWITIEIWRDPMRSRKISAAILMVSELSEHTRNK